MRRTLGVLPVLVAVVLATGCGAGNGRSGGGGSTPGSVVTKAPAVELHNDAFPCNLATQSEIAAVAGTSVQYDEIEPDGQTCVYMLTGLGATHVDIEVFSDEDKATWTALNETFPAWSTGTDLGGKAVTGLGDDAFLTETPGYAGQLDIWKATKLLRITVDVPRRLADADVDKLIALGHTVAGRI